MCSTAGRLPLEKERKLGIWEKYLSLWVVLCIVAGITIGKTFPQISTALAQLQVANISIPIAILLFAMIYPIMVQIPFHEIKQSAKNPKPLSLTLFMNWLVSPFTMALFAWFFMSVVFGQFLTAVQIQEFRAGMILLGIAPCTAMVLVWSYMARANVAHTLVMTAINSLTMVILYAPMATLLLGISGIVVPWATIAFAVVVYICTPLVAGHVTRHFVLKSKGEEWFKERLIPSLGKMAIISLLITLVILFIYQGGIIFELPAIIGMITVGIFLNIMLVFAVAYLVARWMRLHYEDAASAAIIAGSNHFEVAIAVATTLFGVGSGAALATTVGVLTEVPIMLFLVWLCKRTRGFFK